MERSGAQATQEQPAQRVKIYPLSAAPSACACRAPCHNTLALAKLQEAMGIQASKTKSTE
eukprot:5605491-Amphidinium_carterae.2